MATIQEIFNSVYQAAATLLKIGGGAADDAAAAGNPVLTAGKYSAAPATRHDGDAVTQQMTATGAAHVAASGMAAHDAAAAGNPVQVGGVYRVADPALADGDVGSLRVNAKGEALMQLTGSITDTPTVATAGVASGVALAANANRKYARFQNDSTNIIYLKIGAAAVLNQGIRLNANGGGYEMSAALGNLDARVVNCITSVAAQNLLVGEGV